MHGNDQKDNEKDSEKKKMTGKTVCDLNMCTGCMACVEICPNKAINICDELKCQNAVIDGSKCVNCDLCKRVCQVENPLMLKTPIKWYQGWAKDLQDRMKSSSGAFAYELSKKIILDGGYVAACKFEDGRFDYCLANSIQELEQFRGSMYIKSNPVKVYSPVKRLLDEEQQVLFIGLPCHVASLKKYLGKEYENLITADLVCHGSPSPKLLEMFFAQYDIDLASVKSIQFRKKGNFRICGKRTGPNDSISQEFVFTEPGIRDRYTIAFMYGLIFTENCYHCHYAGTNRVSDITLGDSWGSSMDKTNREKGISLALCQTEKGQMLLEQCQVELHDVDKKMAIEANNQLREPFRQPYNRDVFFEALECGKRFNKAVALSFPKACFRLDTKNCLLRIKHLLRKNA